MNRSNEFTDTRLRYYWDKDQLAAKAWQSVLDIERVAWDVYFLYGAEAHWQDKPTHPDFWMHQLTGIDTGPFLDPEKFEAKTQELLNTMD